MPRQRQPDDPCSGLGLSLVAAIAKLHGFTLRIVDTGPGCVVELDCQPGLPIAAQVRLAGSFERA